jgi:hypothetical protein
VNWIRFEAESTGCLCGLTLAGNPAALRPPLPPEPGGVGSFPPLASGEGCGAAYGDGCGWA